MPPKAKFSREEIIDVALMIVKKNGFSRLTARSLGEQLGSSSRPIFTVFENMEEVQQEVMKAAKNIYKEYIQKGLSQKIPFKGVGMQYILFSIEEPKLFQLLFMKQNTNNPDIQGVLPLIDESYPQILESIENEYGLDEAKSLKLYQHLWIYTHGIATLCATKMCQFTSEDIDHMISELFISLLLNIKMGERA
ncbi:MAG: TetR/AcrR family transcriptional regulator [Longibaculum sp.]